MSRLQRLSNVSILWRIFAVNAFVFSAAVVILIVSPATIHSHIRRTELIVLIVGTLATLFVDLLLLAFVLSPVRGLARLMGDIDPLRPGARAQVGSWASAEASVLAHAFNKMLDRLESERRESARRALAAQEAERLRIARELHDEVGQTMTALALQAERAVQYSSEQPRVLSEIVRELHSSLTDVRRMARELRPEALDDLGLIDALIALCTRIEQQGSMLVRREFEVHLPKLSSEVELVVYRVAQEALTNALRHSRASQVSVSLTRRAGGVQLSVADDGHGISGEPGEGDGLTGMRERAMLIQGELELDSTPGDGLRLALTVPVQAGGA